MNAIEKLNNERAKAQSNYEKMVADALVKRCKESKALCEDVLKANKTLANCFEYIKSKAKKEAKNGCAVVEDDKVYEWAEDYYHAQNLDIDKPKPKTEAPKYDVKKAIAQAQASVAKSAPKKSAPQKKATVVQLPKKQTAPTKPTPKPAPKTPTIKVNSDGQFSLF